MASFQDSPDEVILKVIKYLDINELVKFGEVSKRMKAISNDKSLWQKMNLSRDRPSWSDEFDVPTKFVNSHKIQVSFKLFKVHIKNGMFSRFTR